MADSLLVTGGAGFIGSAFVGRMIARGRSVVVLDKLSYAGNQKNLDHLRDSPRLTFVQGDIADQGLVARLLATHGCGAVINFAAETHVDRSIDHPTPFVATNVVGVCRLLDASLAYWGGMDDDTRPRFRFVQISTDEVYGSLGDEGRFVETSPYTPNSPYSASKAAADHFVRAYHQTFGLPTIVTCSSNNYGPRQFPEKLIPLMIRKGVRGEPMPVYGRGDNVRDWLHVDDHAAGLEAVLDRGRAGETYNLGSGEERSTLDVVRSVCREIELAKPNLPHTPTVERIRLVADRPGHDFRYALDTTKARRELGWAPVAGFNDGIRDTVAWYLANEAWVVDALAHAGYDCGRLGLERAGDSDSAGQDSTSS